MPNAKHSVGWPTPLESVSATRWTVLRCRPRRRRCSERCTRDASSVGGGKAAASFLIIHVQHTANPVCGNYSLAARVAPACGLVRCVSFRLVVICSNTINNNILRRNPPPPYRGSFRPTAPTPTPAASSCVIRLDAACVIIFWIFFR